MYTFVWIDTAMTVAWLCAFCNREGTWESCQNSDVMLLYPLQDCLVA